jgi:hypothetical protein
MVEAAQDLIVRESKLRALIAKAGTDSDGRLASSLAYKADYAATRGDLDELRKTAAGRNCKLPDPSTVPITDDVLKAR